MTICLVSQEYPPHTAHGGIGTQTWNKARWLAGLGHDVHVVTCAARPAADVVVEQQGRITAHYLPPPGEEPGREFPVSEPSVYWMGYSWKVAEYLHRLSRRTALHVIDFPDYGAEGFGYLLTRGSPLPVPVVIQLHGSLAMCATHHGWPEAGSEFYRVGTLMEQISIRHADALMACSANIADFTAAFDGVPREDIAVVYCGVDCATFHPAARRDHERPTVLFVGDISAKKGAHIVFDAVLRLRERHPDVRLVMAGKTDDELAGELQARAHHEAPGVEFPGFVDHACLAQLYREADIFASGADRELGVANVYVEAMASGCPIVAPASGGAAEAVVHEETGLLVAPGDVRAVAAALDRLLGDRPLRNRLGAGGRRRAEARFAMDEYIASVLDVYDRAIRAAGNTPHVPERNGSWLSKSLS
jgi:glycogen(starch) synthase